MMYEKYILFFLVIFVIVIMVKFSAKLIKFLLVLFLGFIFFVLAGCSSGNLNPNSSINDTAENSLTRIHDMPFIVKSKLELEESLIMGEGKSWSGQLFMSIPSRKAEVFNFYVRNLDDYGWKEQTTIRGETSILNYIGKNNRVVIITITEGRFNSSNVLISVSPFGEEFEDKIGEYINEKYLEITE